MTEKVDPTTSLQDADKLEFAAHTQENAIADVSSGELITVEKGYTDVLAELPPEEARRALSKVDYRLVPLLSLLYLVAFIDRSNIGNVLITPLVQVVALLNLL